MSIINQTLGMLIYIFFYNCRNVERDKVLKNVVMQDCEFVLNLSKVKGRRKKDDNEDESRHMRKALEIENSEGKNF